MAGTPRVAVLYQALDPPILNGVSKPRKTGGYQDSVADFAWTLNNSGTEIITPVAKPDLGVHEGWGVTHFWANIILFSEHPLQTSGRLNHFEKDVRVVGQPPRFVEVYDDKYLVNEIADFRAVSPNGALASPIVGKPALEGLERHVETLLGESPSIILKEYMSGQEGAVTVMPPSEERPEYWAMSVVVRFNQVGGISPYNGNVAVTAN
ncbi:putative ATP-grasp domain-containing protein [Seiridium cardinale]|uniref:ATP-grasp domain-containing protein n=1 Tax=Seiridium cardinale TaxID=138064 RepID=A0ABR2Y8E8_9PEZI